MKQTIGKKISELRKGNKITQEQLAAAIGVSAPAVSKWETGSSNPDIELLAPIARFFHTSIDSLLHYEQELTEEEVLRISKSCSSSFETGDYDEALGGCDRYLMEYPNSLKLKFHIAMVLQTCIYKTASVEKREKAIQKAICLLEDAIMSEELKIKLNAQALLGNLYMMENNYEKAESIFSALPRVEVNPDLLLPSLYFLLGKNDEAWKLNQKNLANAICYAYLSLSSMISLSIRQENTDFALKLAEAQRKLIEIFELEIYYQPQNYILYIMIYSTLKNEAGVLDKLEKYIEWILNLNDNTVVSGSSFFGRLEEITLNTSAERLRNNQIQAIKSNKYLDFVRHTERYQSIMGKLEAAIS